MNTKHKFILGETVKYQSGLWKVFDITSKEVTLIPITDKVIKGFIMSVPDRSRKPLVFVKAKTPNLGLLT